jgi:hypothetical protein
MGYGLSGGWIVIVCFITAFPFHYITVISLLCLQSSFDRQSLTIDTSASDPDSLVRIRTQHFRLNRYRTDPIRIQDIDVLKLEKLQLKKVIYFFYQKLQFTFY